MTDNKNEIMSAIAELRSEVEKKNADVGKVAELHASLDKIEAKNQEMVAKQQTQENESRQLKEQIAELETLSKNASKENLERIKDLESEIALKTKHGTDAEAWKSSEEHRAFKDYYLKAVDTSNTLRTDVEAQGGYLVVNEFAKQILKKMTEISPVRQFARVLTTSKKGLIMPIEDEIPVAKYEGETESSENSTIKYKSKTLTTYRQTTTIPVTLDMLQFAEFDMESEISRAVSTAFGLGEAQAFLKGTGVKQPEGILTNTDISKIQTSAAGAMSFDDVLSLPAELKAGYNGVYGFNKKTLYSLRTAKDGNGNYLWRVGGESMPSTIGDFKYVIMQDMPDVAVDATPVMFGDLYAGYTILDSTQLSLVRDPYTSKKEAIVEMTWNRWNTGGVTMPEAIKLLQIKAS